MTRPQSVSRMVFNDSRMVRKAPSRLVDIILRQNSISVLCTALPSAMPALGMQIWIGPWALTAAAILATTSSSLRTSIAMPVMLSPATSSSTSWRRPVMVTCAPRAARSRAMSSPMPVPPPVISACFPCRSILLSLMKWIIMGGMLSAAGGRRKGARVFTQRRKPKNRAVSAIDAAKRCSNYVRLLYYRNPSAIALGNIIAPHWA